MIAFSIPCIPPKCTSQQKRAVSLPGHGIRFFKKKEVQQAEDSLTALINNYRPQSPLTGPVELRMSFHFPWRKSEPKKNRATGSKPNDVRPDLDNMAKLVIDVMTRLGFWLDDGQIASLHLEKHWGDWTGIKVEVEGMTSQPLPDLTLLHAKGAIAWKDVVSATQWVEEMRGNIVTSTKESEATCKLK